MQTRSPGMQNVHFRLTCAGITFLKSCSLLLKSLFLDNFLYSFWSVYHQIVDIKKLTSICHLNIIPKFKFRWVILIDLDSQLSTSWPGGHYYPRSVLSPLWERGFGGHRISNGHLASRSTTTKTEKLRTKEIVQSLFSITVGVESGFDLVKLD